MCDLEVLAIVGSRPSHLLSDRPHGAFIDTAGGTTATLQQGLNSYAGATDNWIVAYSGADINRGADVDIAIRDVTDYGIVRFNIFAAEGGPVPNGVTITSATLSMYKAFGPDAVFKASRVLKPWTEMGSTWNSTSAGARSRISTPAAPMSPSGASRASSRSSRRC